MSEYVPWYVDSQLEFLFEMPTEQLTPLVPLPLQVVEPRPGVGLLWVGFLRFEAGNIDVLPVFHEATCNVIVHPRVEDGGVRPDFATFVVRIASDCAQFDDWAQRVDRMTVVDCPGLRARVDRTHASCAVEDARGPIFTLASSVSEAGWREEALLKIQVFSHDSDGLWEGWVEWFGSYADHQRPTHPDTRLANHPFFGELDVRTARCVRQMYTVPAGDRGDEIPRAPADSAGAFGGISMTDATDFSLADFLIGFSDDPLVPDDEFVQWRRATAWATSQYEPVMADAPGARTRILVDGEPRQVLNLASYNYLGLAGHPHVLDAATAALRQFGLGTCGSPLLSGLTPLHRRLEKGLARLVGKPDAMLFNSGFGGALGCLGGLLRRGDVAVLDADAHICLHDGARVAGAQVRTFAHNDPEDLDRVLTQTSGSRRVVVVEGVYSVFGDMVALPAIVGVAREHRVQVMIDEAHSILVLGEHGGGVVDHFGLEDEVGLIYGTFSKSFAALGGFVAGSVETLDYLRCYANTYVFSCALSAPIVAGVEAALQVAAGEPQRRARVLAEADWFRAQLRGIGIDTGASAAQVVPIIVGSDRRRLYDLGHALRRAGLFLAPFDYPSVPEDRLCFRACITASHQRADLEEALDILERVVVGRPPPARNRRSEAGRKSILLFPGQSSFDPRMLREARALWPELTQEILAMSSAALERDLSDWLDEVRPRGNEDLQVAVFVTTQVHLRALQRVHEDEGRSLGLSLGEYNHLVHIGALDFTDGVRLVAARGAAYDQGPPGAMAAVFPLNLGELEEILATDERTRTVEIVNLNSPTQNVIAGEAGAVRAAITLIESETFARTVIIDPLHPMHSSLYRPVADTLRPHLEATRWRSARHPYLPNVTAEPVSSPSPDFITDMLCQHVCQPVHWRASIDRALREMPDGGRDALFIEVGPGTVLTDLLRAPWRVEPRVSTSRWSRTMEALNGLHEH